MSCELAEATIIDGRGFRRLPWWMSRPLDALAADVRLVDSGSLDVLLYCADDVVVGTVGEWRLAAPADLT